MRKTYYFKNRILKNSVISLDDLIFKRPFIKENSFKIFNTLGKKSIKNKKIDSAL